MSLFSLKYYNLKWHFKFYAVPRWKPRFIQINFLTLLCPSEFFHGIQPKLSAITRKVQISDRSDFYWQNWPALLFDMPEVSSDSVCRNLYMDNDSPCSMKSPVHCIYKDLFIWNAVYCCNSTEQGLLLFENLNIKKAIVHGTPAADRSRHEDKRTQQYLSRKGK